METTMKYPYDIPDRFHPVVDELVRMGYKCKGIDFGFGDEVRLHVVTPDKRNDVLILSKLSCCVCFNILETPWWKSVLERQNADAAQADIEAITEMHNVPIGPTTCKHCGLRSDQETYGESRQRRLKEALEKEAESSAEYKANQLARAYALMAKGYTVSAFEQGRCSLFAPNGGGSSWHDDVYGEAAAVLEAQYNRDHGYTPRKKP